MADAVAQTYTGLVMKLIAEAKSNARPDS
jgi:hypothetical protein